MDLVIIESPYAGATPEIIARNIAYARAAMRDALGRGEAPYASHLLYTQPGVLRDEIPAERDWGIKAGFEFRKLAKRSAFYTDLGMSSGMEWGLKHSTESGIEVVYRSIPFVWPLDQSSGPHRSPGW